MLSGWLNSAGLGAQVSAPTCFPLVRTKATWENGVRVTPPQGLLIAIFHQIRRVDYMPSKLLADGLAVQPGLPLHSPVSIHHHLSCQVPSKGEGGGTSPPTGVLGDSGGGVLLWTHAPNSQPLSSPVGIGEP